MLVALWGSITATAHAQSTGLRLVLVQPENAELITRVEGQTRDLGVTLQVAPRGWTRGTAEQAAAIAAEHDADFVARLQRSRGRVLEVRVYAARARTLRSRRVPHARSERLGTSAELEAAALVLRGELTALIEAEREAAEAREASPSGGAGGAGSGTPPGAAGGTPSDTGASGSPERQPDPPKPAEQPKPRPTEQPKPREPDTDDTTDEEAEPEAEPEEEEEEEDDEVEVPSAPLENYTAGRSPWTLRGGARGSLPVRAHVAGSLLIGARAPVASFLELGLSLATALPFEISDPTAGITLRRSSLSAEALAAIPVGPRLRLLVGVDAGVVLYARKTNYVGQGFAAEASEPNWAATLGAQAELQWLLARRFGVALGGGLSYLPKRTRFAYRDDPASQPRDIAELRSLEPHATVSLFGLLGD